MTTQSNATTVELPSGCRHHRTSLFAESREAYDALTAEDGWKEFVRYRQDTGEPFAWKSGEIRGHEITVHAPDEERDS